MGFWINSHPGERVTIYDIATIVGQSLPLATTPKNITAGFEVSGIWPLNPEVFDESEFAPSIVTDRPLEDGNVAVDNVNQAENVSIVESNNNTLPEFSPEHVRPFPQPKALDNPKRKGRKKGKSAVLTSSLKEF